MCWNASASITAFICGIISCLIVSILSFKDKKYQLMVLSIGWVWVIFMQLWEYFIWKNPNNSFYPKMAYLFNISQVIILGLLFLTFFTDQNLINRGVASIILLVYSLYFFYYNAPMTIKKDSGHLEYDWWTGNNASLIYLTSLIMIFLLLIKPFFWSFFTLLYILALLLLSRIFYSKSVASMWCFFAVSVPIFSYLISLIKID